MALLPALVFLRLNRWRGNIFREILKQLPLPEDEETQENGGTGLPAAEQDVAPEELNAFSYNEIMESMYTTAAEAFKSCVSVTASSDTEDWESVSTGIGKCYRVIAADNGQELLILADHSICADAPGWNVTFADGRSYAATLKKQDKNSETCCFRSKQRSVSTADTWAAIKVADFG